MWITNSLQADWMCLLANTSQGKPHLNKSLIVVPMNEPGVVKVENLLRLSLSLFFVKAVWTIFFEA